MIRTTVLAALALGLVACSAEAPSESSRSMVVTGAAPAAPVATSEEYAAADGAAQVAPEAPLDAARGGAVPSAPGAEPGAGAPMLAYVFGVSLELPSRNVRTVMAAHEQACRSAGVRLCQVVNSSISDNGDDGVYGSVSIRAEPRWLQTFRDGLEKQAKDAGGRLREQTVNSEDLTRQIVDTSARLNALKTLRDRLQSILRTRPGKLSDLLETERELARVQGEIDGLESALAVMRERVATSILNLNYQSRANPVTGGTFDPVMSAITDFVGIVMQGIGFIIRLVAFLIPVLLVVAPLVWYGLRWRARRRLAKRAAES